jgi:hypothetical protein
MERSRNITPSLAKKFSDKGFCFRRLDLPGIDNSTVIAANDPTIAEQEVCLFSEGVSSGGEYLDRFQRHLLDAAKNRQPFPCARFADGEYAFYAQSLDCNGLYRQAESVAAIRAALPMHVEALRRLAAAGQIAALVFPGNLSANRSLFKRMLRPWKRESSAVSFLKFLDQHGIELSAANYLPFYVVYACLSSEEFRRSLDGKHVCIVNSDYDEGNCRRWFERLGSRPRLTFVPIAAEYVATRWSSMKEDVLGKIPPDTDLCLVGAGVGALPVCVDAAMRFSVPAIDAGHILNMMNGREDKSNGMRLYTLWKERPSGG